jgi:hypothetical protein
MSLSRIGVAAVATLACSAIGAAAQAAPYNSHTFDLRLRCDDGSAYVLSVVDNQGQSPGHDEDSTSVFIPTDFGEFHITVSDLQGNVLDEEVAPPQVSHGRSGEQVTTLHCSFSQSELETIPDAGEVRILVEGTVDGFLSH